MPIFLYVPTCKIWGCFYAGHQGTGLLFLADTSVRKWAAIFIILQDFLWGSWIVYLLWTHVPMTVHIASLPMLNFMWKNRGGGWEPSLFCTEICYYCNKYAQFFLKKKCCFLEHALNYAVLATNFSGGIGLPIIL